MPDAVNGPEGGLAWDAINWRAHDQNVARLRQRIFTATRDGDWPKVRNLQKMMLRSWSNTLVSVRQVTQRNAGRATAGARTAIRGLLYTFLSADGRLAPSGLRRFILRSCLDVVVRRSPKHSVPLVGIAGRT